MIHQEINGK